MGHPALIFGILLGVHTKCFVTILLIGEYHNSSLLVTVQRLKFYGLSWE